MYECDFRPRAIRAVRNWGRLSETTLNDIYEASLAFEENQKRFDDACEGFVKRADASHSFFKASRQDDLLAWFFERFEAIREACGNEKAEPANLVEQLEELISEFETVADSIAAEEWRRRYSETHVEHASTVDLITAWLNDLEIASLDDFTQEKVQRAFRRLAKVFHPDRHKSATKREAEENFKRINEAYEQLMKVLDRRAAER